MAKAQTKAGKKKTFKRKERRLVPQGIVHIQASFNNTLVSITDLEGNLISQSSSGALGFHGSREGHSFAAQQAGILRRAGGPRAWNANVRSQVKVRGQAASRQSVLFSPRGLKFGLSGT
jgi:small subunit ribosomal protein S11